MELWEFNSCLKAYNKKQELTGKEKLTLSWYTAAFTGSAFNGKLKKLNHYLKEDKKQIAPAISKEEFNKKLQKLKNKERRMQHGT